MTHCYTKELHLYFFKFLSHRIGGGNGFMKKLKLSVLVLVVFVLGMSFGGCSKPPETEKEAAKKAMDAAISGGADKYATPDLEAAKKVWDTAESRMKEKKYPEAKQNYIDAKTAFEKAASAVETGKKAVANQVNEGLKTLEESWKKLNTTAKKMEKRLKEKKKDWMNDAKAINQGLGKAKEMIAESPAEAKAKLDELKGVIEKWESNFKEMTSAPAKPKAIKKKKK
jgi:hypothetical protein